MLELEFRDGLTNIESVLHFLWTGSSLDLAASLWSSPALHRLVLSLSLFFSLVTLFLAAVVVLVPRDSFLGVLEVPLVIRSPPLIVTVCLGVFTLLLNIEKSFSVLGVVKLWGWMMRG